MSSFISSLIAICTNQSNREILPSSRRENTNIPTIIEASPDKNYHIIIVEGNLRKEETFYCHEEINRFLVNNEEISDQYLRRIQRNEDFEEILITIQILNFP